MSGGGMEVEVRVVGGARSCFVALPLHLLHALERTSATGDLPPVLALDLRGPAGGRWSLAWSGAASRSRAIEVAQELAECISLPDGTIAQLSVARSLAKAEKVNIEPYSEDDWEILERRAELAEETILKQVGIVYEGMKFPLWLDGHNIVKFVVVSSRPEKSVGIFLLLRLLTLLQPLVETAWSAPINNTEDVELHFRKLELGEPVSFGSVVDSGSTDGFKLTKSSLGWMENAMSDVIKRLSVLLSSTSLRLFNRLKFPFPGHVLVYGPRGSGKTALTRVSAKYFEDHKEILAHVSRIYRDCSKLALGKAKETRQAIEDSISEALLHSPSIIIFDDLDSLISASSDPQVSQSSSSSDSLVRCFADIMDEYKVRICQRNMWRFDFHIELPALAVPERKALLKHHVEEHELQCSEEVLSEIASKCEGYDAYDLEILVDRAVHAAASRFVMPSNSSLNSVKPTLVMEDFSKAMHGFLPVAMRDLRKYAPDDKDGGWEDVGGLNEAVTIIKETLELPSKYPNIFTRAPVRLRSNILLYGPPGCGKTHIVRAAAAACSLRFISVKGPELLNKYIGSSEQSVRDFFAKAVAAAPCLLFFDEFDSIAPQRGTHSAGVSDRVVNQFLTELDGVETLTGVFVFAATSKPQLIDAALLRPGRFDRLIFCDFPRWDERLEILKVHSRTVSLASDASLEDVASLTEGFTGADLAAILTDAGLAAVHELLDNQENGVPDSEPCISKELLMSVARKARPSTPADEKRRYDREFGEFVSSRKSISTKVHLNSISHNQNIDICKRVERKKGDTSLSLSNTSTHCR
nr:unnamed protein product [Digitaria exilis]